MTSTFLIKSSMELAGRGAFLLGEVKAGWLNIGMKDLQSGLKVKTVNFMDAAGRNSSMAVGFETPLSKDQLDKLFPTGNTITFQSE